MRRTTAAATGLALLLSTPSDGSIPRTDPSGAVAPRDDSIEKGLRAYDEFVQDDEARRRLEERVAAYLTTPPDETVLGGLSADDTAYAINGFAYAFMRSDATDGRIYSVLQHQMSEGEVDLDRGVIVVYRALSEDRVGISTVAGWRIEPARPGLFGGREERRTVVQLRPTNEEYVRIDGVVRMIIRAASLEHAAVHQEDSAQALKLDEAVVIAHDLLKGPMEEWSAYLEENGLLAPTAASSGSRSR